MKACPLTFSHPSEAQQLNGLGPKLCDRLTEKLKAHCSDNGLAMPTASHGCVYGIRVQSFGLLIFAVRKRLSADEPSAESLNHPAKRTRRPKEYVPALRSGPYALILALSSLSEDSIEGLTKAQLIQQAQDYCDTSFTAPTDTSKFYTAWNSMKTLVDKDLVYEKGRPLRRYYLSDEGWEVAKRIKTVQGGGHVLQGVVTIRNSLESQVLSNHVTAIEEDETCDVDSVDTGEQAGRSNNLSRKLKTRLVSGAERAVDREFFEIISSPDPEPRTIGSAADMGKRIGRSNSQPRAPFHDSRSARHKNYDVEKTQFPPIQPILLQPGTFTVQLVLDSREIRAKNDRDYIQDELTKRGVDAIVRPLELGDFFWVAKYKDPRDFARYGEEGDEVALDWIVERKRLDDLVGSIKDGRFHEQKFRLRKSGVKNVVYIIEDFSMSSEKNSHYHEAIESAIGSMQVVDGYFVKKTTKLDDTIRYLTRMTALLKNVYEVCSSLKVSSNSLAKPLISQSKPINIIPTVHLQTQTYLPLLGHLRASTPEISYHITYASFAALASKSDSLTLRDVFLKMLMCTRGVTGDKALEIQKYWATPRAFLEALEGCNGKKERELMLNTKLGGVIGRRKLGKAVCEKIAEIWGEA